MKRYRYFVTFRIRILVAAMCCVIVSGCQDFVDVELSKSKVTSELVFSDDNTAEAALIGIYHNLIQSFLIGGSENSLGRLTGLSADELSDYNITEGISQFEDNDLTADNNNVLGVWEVLYKTIYGANVAIESLTNSNSISNAARNQLTGEAKFIRAFSYFYLVNLFGDVPLVISSDYRKNSTVTRVPTSMIYEHIVSDLKSAEELLADSYKNNERVRPIAASATALLARVYLYIEDWSNAESASTAVIENAQYQLLGDPGAVFLKNSKEAIWQLPPVLANNTNEALYYVLTSSSTKYLVLRAGIVNAFEPGDARATNWLGSYNVSGQTLYFPHKYKLYNATAPIAEYLMVLRLAEQYLIRAEARAHLGDLPNAIADLDVIRSRAGLPLISSIDPSITQADFLLAVEHERQVELFTEWGHRWLDLKRTGRAEVILGGLKTSFTREDQLYPIPERELGRNPVLGNQNPGY